MFVYKTDLEMKTILVKFCCYLSCKVNYLGSNMLTICNAKCPSVFKTVNNLGKCGSNGKNYVILNFFFVLTAKGPQNHIYFFIITGPVGKNRQKLLKVILTYD